MRRLTPDLEFLRAVEVQKRGALHLHVIVYSPIPLDRAALRRLAIGYGFGHELDLAAIVPGSRKHAYYVSKYVTKACDSRDEVPWRADVLVNPGTGEVQRLLTVASYRTWSSSQGWGLTMKDVRAACASAARARAVGLAADVSDPCGSGPDALDSPLVPAPG